MRVAIAFVLLLTVSGTASAQRRCVKGIPCGGTCISATKTCRVGTAPAPKARSLGAADSVAPAVRTPLIPVEQARAIAPFVGSATGHTYYPVGDCFAATQIPDSLRVYFASESAARLLRYDRVTRCF